MNWYQKIINFLFGKVFNQIANQIDNYIIKNKSNYDKIDSNSVASEIIPNVNSKSFMFDISGHGIMLTIENFFGENWR